MSLINFLFPHRDARARALGDAGFLLETIEHVVVPMFALDRDGNVMIWNPACERLTGLAASEVIGTRNHWKGFYKAERPCLADMVYPGRGAGAAGLYATQDSSGNADGRLRAQNWCDLPRGERRYLTIDAGPIRNAKGEIIAVVETLQDLTPHKRMEEDLREAQEAVEQAISQEREIVARSIGEGLSRLARQDLTYRIASDLPEAYLTLRENFNLAAGELEAALLNVTEGASAIDRGAGEISAAAENLSRRTEQQAASLEETAAALEEITATVRKTADGAKQAREVVARREVDAKQERPDRRQADRRHGQDREVLEADQPDHRRHRRDRVPDQPARPERRRRSRARGRCGTRICRRRDRGARARAALRRCRQGDQDADLGSSSEQVEPA